MHRRRHGHRDDYRAGVTFSPSPLVGEGGANARSGFGPGEGFVSADRDPSSAFASRRHLLPQGEKGTSIGSTTWPSRISNSRLDADGIALVTWDIPGRSMNVLDETSVDELEAIVKQTTDRCRGEGRRHHLQQGGVLRRRRSLDARGHEPHLCEDAEGEGRGRGQPDAVRPEPPFLAGVPQHRNLGQAVGRRHQRARARRRL